MSRSTSEKLEEIIVELSEKLHEGGKIYREVKGKYDRWVSVMPFERLFVGWKFVTKNSKLSDPWYKQTFDYLETNFPNSIYTHQFMSPHDDIDPGREFNWKTRYIKTFQSRIEVVENIIQQLKNELLIEARKKLITDNFSDEVLYRIDYNEHNRLIKLNNIVIAHPNFNSANELFFTHVYQHPNELVTLEDIETATNEKFTKQPKDILADLHFKGKLKDIFFPSVSKTAVKFMNPITKQYALDNDLPELDIASLAEIVGNSKKS